MGGVVHQGEEVGDSPHVPSPPLVLTPCPPLPSGEGKLSPTVVPRPPVLTPLIPSPFGRGETRSDRRSRPPVLTPLIPSPFGRGETRARPSFPLSAFAERGTGGEDPRGGQEVTTVASPPPV